MLFSLDISVTMSSGRKSELLKYTGSTTIQSKSVLSPDEAELYELTHLAGVIMDPKVFK